ncbi:Lrp/AsnC family transcriptional regulator [Paraburkholderia sp. GAS206C]|uniref:Lrp/AsnC family transcriptional regulator n=1 Tax=unclassified Paraburkholderia TaxID=2615204 RepID=UPI003D25E01E
MPIDRLDDLDLRILSVLQTDCALSNVDLAERVHTSPPTCLRRVKRLRDSGVIKRQIAIIDHEKLGETLTAIIEVTLDRQTEEDHETFKTYICGEHPITQCYRVSPGPDFIVIAHVANMAAYDRFARRLFTSASNIRNVRTFFSTCQYKFEASAPVQLSLESAQ